MLIEEKLRKEEEVMLVETNYQNLQDEVDDMRRLIKNFRVRYKQAVNEINDLNEEHARERSDLFEHIQTYEKEL
jgi:kinesin family protein 3/17